MNRGALLFDLDGTLLDSDVLHYQIFAELLAERGKALTPDDYKARIMGRPNASLVEEFFPGEDHSVLDRKEAIFRERLGTSAQPIAGIGALLDWAASERIGCAVVTNAPRLNAEAMLAAIGLETRFPVLVIGEECVRAKPDPAPYQAAMAALGVTPSVSIAFEDSRSGLRAARDSGARVVGMTTGLNSAALREAGAHVAITDFTDPVLQEELGRLLGRLA